VCHAAGVEGQSLIVPRADGQPVRQGGDAAVLAADIHAERAEHIHGLDLQAGSPAEVDLDRVLADLQSVGDWNPPQARIHRP